MLLTQSNYASKEYLALSLNTVLFTVVVNAQTR